MTERMGGDRREWEYPVLTFEEETVVTAKEKAEIMAKSFTKSSKNLLQEGTKWRESAISQHPGVLHRRKEKMLSMNHLLWLI